MDTQQFDPTDFVELKINHRTTSGKGVARKLRKSGKIPGVFYGLRHDPVSLVVDPDELLKALSTPKLKNTLIRMVSEDSDLNGRHVLVQTIQRHPVSREFLHVDFIEVYPDKAVKTKVPVNLVGHPKGVELGGTLDQQMREVYLTCPADKIPAEITVDVSELDIGDTIKLEEIQFGEGVDVLEDLESPIASVAAPRVLEETVTAEEEEGEEGEEAAEGEAAEGEGEEGGEGEGEEGGEE